MTGLPIDATQGLGIAGFLLAAVACLWATRRQRQPWRTLAAVQCVAAMEVALGGRYAVHDGIAALLRAEGAYEGRAPWQSALIAATLAAAVWALLAGLRRSPQGPGVAGAMAGSAWTVAVFVIEAISLHGVDALMYASAGPVKFIAWLWLAGSLLTAASALRARLRPALPNAGLKPPWTTRPRP